MFKSLENAWLAVQDSALESAARLYLNQEVRSFGKISQLSIDRKQRKLFVQVELKGETSPVSVNVDRYELTEKEGSTFVTIHDVTASREWIGLALQKYVTGRQFRLPPAARQLLSGGSRDA